MAQRCELLSEEAQSREFSFRPLGHHHLELRVVVVQVRADAGGQEPGAGAVMANSAQLCGALSIIAKISQSRRRRRSVAA